MLSMRPESKNDNDLHKLMFSGNRIKLKKGQVVHNSDGRMRLTLIKSGFIMRYQISNNGSLNIQSIYGAGYIYPLTHVFKLLFDQDIYTGPETFYYETLSDSEIYTIESTVLIGEVKKNPGLYRDLLIEAGVRFYSNIQRLENIALDSATKRLAHQLAYYVETFSTKTLNNKIKITLPLTHATLAAVLSVARETVSHSMIELRDLKLIKSSYHSIIILDLQGLRDFAFS